MNFDTTSRSGGERLLGTWYLDEAYAVTPQGERLFDVYGVNPSGVIHYGADGRMMALITHGGRALLQGDRQAAPADQRAAAYKSSIGYAGTYELKEDWVFHHVDLSTYPNWVGATLPRRVQFEGDKVVLLTTPQIQDGRETILKLIWQRTPVLR